MQRNESLELTTRISVDLSTTHDPQIADEGSTPPHESSLPPVDKGFHAWAYLTGAFFVEGVVWGFPIAYGTFLDAYLSNPYYASQKNASFLLPMIGTLESGIMYCSGSILYPAVARYPYYRRRLMWTGAVICFASLLAASYCTKVIELVIMQGVLYAIGGSLVYSPCISYMSEWFVSRRGMANGTIFAGAPVGGLILPLVLSRVLDAFGPSKTLRFMSVIFAGMSMLILPFIRGRLPESRISGPRARTSDWSWLKSASFWLVLTASTMQGFGFFIPILWLPTFATALNLGPTRASLTLAVLNGGSAIGGLGQGFMSDKIDPWLIALANLVVTVLATFILWGVLSNTFAGLMAFGITYGMVAGGWSSLWTSLVRPIAKDNLTLSTSLFGYLFVSRGLGNVISTFIATILVKGSTGDSVIGGMGFDVGEGKFKNVIFYTGGCFAGATIIAAVAWAFERTRRVNWDSR